MTDNNEINQPKPYLFRHEYMVAFGQYLESKEGIHALERDG